VHIRMAANKQIRYEQLFKYLTLICEQQNWNVIHFWHVKK
jgi:hypothetical protein